ncbi:MAG TPA: hypothetical protein VLD59_15855 [Steroidobacteraceae bacterium]|nr:hypothetical protein [Steroidobacteraceae bacterium]
MRAKLHGSIALNRVNLDGCRQQLAPQGGDVARAAAILERWLQFSPRSRDIVVVLIELDVLREIALPCLEVASVERIEQGLVQRDDCIAKRLSRLRTRWRRQGDHD